MPWGACAFYAPIYSFQFNSFHFISFLFYSAWRKLRIKRNENEIKRKLRNVTKKTKITKRYEKNENYETLRNVTKKRKMLLNNHVIVIFYAKTVYFFIHLKNVFIAFFLIFVHFPFFRSFSFFFVNFVFIRYLWITIFLLNKIVIVRKRFFFIELNE